MKAREGELSETVSSRILKQPSSGSLPARRDFIFKQTICDELHSAHSLTIFSTRRTLFGCTSSFFVTTNAIRASA